MPTQKSTRAAKATRPATSKAAAKPVAKRATSKAASGNGPALLSGGNPQIAKADGDAPVQAYIAAMPDWKRDVGRQIDALVVRAVPKVTKAVRWNTPFYGIEGKGWFLGFHCYTKYVQLSFLNGSSLRPMPPKESKHAHVRYLDIHEDDEIDEQQLTAWLKQASRVPGEMMF